MTSIEFGNFNTNNVVSMRRMFSQCISLTSLDLSDFETENLIKFDGMFNGCKKLEYIDISWFDASKVEFPLFQFNGVANKGKIRYNSSKFRKGLLAELPEEWEKVDLNEV